MVVVAVCVFAFVVVVVAIAVVVAAAVLCCWFGVGGCLPRPVCCALFAVCCLVLVV